MERIFPNHDACFLSHTKHDVSLLYYFFKAHRLDHFELRIATDDQYDWEDEPEIQNFTHCLTFHDRFPRGQLRTFLCEQPVVGRYFMVTIPEQQYLTLCEVEVFGERGKVILYRYNGITRCCSVIHVYEQSITQYYSVIYILCATYSAKSYNSDLFYSMASLGSSTVVLCLCVSVLSMFYGGRHNDPIFRDSMIIFQSLINMLSYYRT